MSEMAIIKNRKETCIIKRVQKGEEVSTFRCNLIPIEEQCESGEQSKQERDKRSARERKYTWVLRAHDKQGSCMQD